MKYIILITVIWRCSTVCPAQVTFPSTGLSSSQKLFNVKDFGAVGDSLTKDTKAIQAAINSCSAKGGTVWVPAGNYIIGTIQLKSNVTLSLDYGASLLGSKDMADYDQTLPPTREGNSECLIFAKDATNIAIEGLGIIDGRGDHIAFNRGTSPPWNSRPRLIRFENCNQLKFSGVTFKRPAFWGIHLVDCSNIHFNSVTIRFRDNNYNNDGLDLDGCKNVVIENCDIATGDDGICLKSSLHPCENIVVRNCRVTSNTAALKFGTSSSGGFIGVSVTNCYFYDSPMGAIKLELVDGGRLENVDISCITMHNVGNPIFIRLGNRGSDFTKKSYNQSHGLMDGKDDGVPVGTLKNIRINDVIAEVTFEPYDEHGGAPYQKEDLKRQKYDPVKQAIKEKSWAGPIMITGIPGHYVEDVTLENIEISYPGGGTKEDAKIVVAEDEKRYPEQYFFGVLPAWGAYIRHAKNITFKNVKMTTRNPDMRKEIILDDVVGFANE